MSLIKGCLFEGEKSAGVEPTATVYEDKSRWKNNGSMTTAKPDWVQLDGGLWVLDFNGTDAVVDVGNVARDMQTVLVWIYPDDVSTRSIMDFDGGTHSIEINGSGDLTATGWSTPTFYTDAVATAVAQTVSVWNFIAVTTATAFTVSDFDIGKEASYFDGKQILIRLVDNALSAGQIRNIFDNEKHYFGR